MSDRPVRGWRPRLLTALCWVMAVAFTVGGITKILPGETFFGPPYSVKFVEWGYPAWFRFLVAAGEIVGAILLVTPRPKARFVGAALLGVILVGAVITHIANRDPVAHSVSAPVHLVLVSIVAWVNRPEKGFRWPGGRAEVAA
ncbi:DoxX family protein [Plantactinospora sp. GCM10030261]|uniref:DoxX family protein n=1 Tax=Plantactinospora sp. GCM10030261 TaxID=3273420 RepID=UPI00361F4619